MTNNSESATADSHGGKTIEEEMSEVLADLRADDGLLHAAFVIRDKQRPYDPPTTFRVLSLDDVKSFVDNIPNHVHVLILSKDDNSAILKLSLSDRKGRYNVHCGVKSPIAYSFDLELLSKVKDQMAPELWEEFFKFCDGIEESDELSDDDLAAAFAAVRG